MPLITAIVNHKLQPNYIHPRIGANNFHHQNWTFHCRQHHNYENHQRVKTKNSTESFDAAAGMLRTCFWEPVWHFGDIRIGGDSGASISDEAHFERHFTDLWHTHAHTHSFNVLSFHTYHIKSISCVTTPFTRFTAIITAKTTNTRTEI